MARWQDPPIEKSRGKRPFYYLRPYTSEVGTAGLKRARKRIRLGYVSQMTMRQAQQRKQEIMATINQGQFVLQSQIRFRDLAERYQKSRLPVLGAATQRKYETHLANHILPAFGPARLCDIDRQSVEVWLNTEAGGHEHVSLDGPPRKYAGLGWWALQDLRNVLSAVFTAAKEWGYWRGDNPCVGARIGRKAEKREKRIPKAEELMKFLLAIADAPCADAETSRLIVLTAIATGMRVSEVLGLQAADIDPAERTIQVRRRWHRGDVSEPKTEASKRVREIGPLADQLLGYAKIRQRDDWIFEHESMPLDDRSFQKQVVKPAARLAGIDFEGFGMHSLRRLNLTWRQEVGATPLEAMKAAGHARLSTTWLYTVTDRDREREHVQKILERIIPRIDGRPN